MTVERRAWMALFGVAALALLLRLSFLVGPGGPLAAPGDYDDGVYFSASALLVRGVLPYRDFVFVHPPGILLFYALTSWLRDPAHAFVAARLLAALVGAANALLAGAIALRAAGPLAGIAAAALYAVYPDAVGVERSSFLEPVLNLACLSSAFVWLAPGERPRRPGLAGVLAGAACAVKVLGGIWVVAALVSPPRERARAALGRFLLGGLIAGGVLVAPFALPAPASFVEQVLTFQLTRPPDGAVERSARLPEIAAGGHLGATLLAAVALIAIGIAIARRSPVTRVERFFATATVLTIAAFLASASFWAQYDSYLAACECVLAGLGAAALVRWTPLPRSITAAALSLALIALQWPSLRHLLAASRTRAPEVVALASEMRAHLAAADAPFVFDPTWALPAGRLPPHGDGAPVIVDTYGSMLLSAVRGGARYPHAAVAFRRAPPQPALEARLRASRFVVLGWRGEWQLRPQDRGWLAANYLCVTPDAGELCLWQRLDRPFDGLTRVAPGEAVSFGEGWYREEGRPPRSWRWMGARSVTVLPGGNGPMRLYLQLHAPIDDLAAPPAIGVEIDGRLIDLISATGAQVTRSYDVDATAADRHELVLTTNRTFRPARRHAAGDRRELGLSLQRLVWLPRAQWPAVR